MVSVECTDGKIYVHSVMMNVFRPSLGGMSRDAGLLLMRLLYGELIGVNVNEWLLNNQIKPDLLNQIISLS